MSRRVERMRLRLARASNAAPRRRGVGTLLAAILVSTALVAQSGALTDATWNDAEWVASPAMAATACGPDAEGFMTRSEGRALSGNLLGANLDSIAEAEGVQVTNDGEVAVASAGQPVNGLESAFRDPLTVNALSALQLPLTGLLELPTNNGTGVVGQFGQSRNTGQALGASGYVTDSGGIDLADDQTGDYPDLATLKLSNLLNSPLLGDIGLGDTLSGVSDLELEVGAVAGQASLDTCAEKWSGGATDEFAGARTMAADAATDVVAGLERHHLAAAADLTFRSAAVGSLVGGIDTTLNGLQGQINALIGQQSVTTSLVNAVATLLNGVLGLLGLGAIQVKKLTATIDTAPVRQLLSTSFGDAKGVLTIDPSQGTIRIDTAALLAKAGSPVDGRTLNGLPPNTDILADPVVLNALTASLTDALADWIGRVQSALTAQIDAIRVTADMSIQVKLLLPVAEITASVDGSLGDLLAGTVKATTSVKLLGALDLGLLNPLLNALVNGLGKTVGDILNPLMTGLRTLPAAVTVLVAPIITVVSRLYNGLFLSKILSITINAQNHPASGGPVPPDWRPGQPSAPPEGQYEVAAIRIGILDGLGQNGVRLYLGRASVGPGCTVAQGAQPGNPCANY